MTQILALELEIFTTEPKAMSLFTELDTCLSRMEAVQYLYFIKSLFRVSRSGYREHRLHIASSLPLLRLAPVL